MSKTNRDTHPLISCRKEREERKRSNLFFNNNDKADKNKNKKQKLMTREIKGIEKLLKKNKK